MDIYLTEYGLTPESLDSFTRMFLFTNKDGVLGISVNQIIWTDKELFELVERGILLGYRLNEMGDKMYLYLSTEFKKNLSHAIYAAATSKGVK